MAAAAMVTKGPYGTLPPPPHPSLRAALELERVQMETAPTFMFGVCKCVQHTLCVNATLLNSFLAHANSLHKIFFAKT
jgi:hypothetical protein